MPASLSATLRLKIDQPALADNWRTLDRWSGSVAAGAAVKADCYGLGVDQCLPTLYTAGARDFFIAHWSEVADVARHVPANSISVLHGPLTTDDVAYAREAGVRPVINSLHQARLWSQAGGGICDLMVDTGMNRLGIRSEETCDPAIQALSVDILMSHLSSADEDSAENTRQLERFRAVTSLVQHKRASLANSAGVALGSDYHFDLTRPGLSLYGGIPRAELASEIKAVVQLEAAIIQRRRVRAGETVGYNGTYRAPVDMQVGIVSLGYADGFLRAWGGKGNLVWRGKPLPLVGRVSMDMVAVDLSLAPEVREGDFLSVPYDLPQAAAATGLSQYELLTVLGHRFAH